MPSKKQYDLVLDEGPDSKIPLHNEDAFQHGIHFHAKYIGTLDVPRPTSRIEIVAAMRRIRYEFKAKAVKKKKVSLCVSVEGVKVTLQKKSRRKQQQSFWDESRLTLLQHPIYRIFYVSHDSQDLKIFSYIARDSSTNVFRCNVFKAYKKSQAMNIVRTIGQAFEVCHRISLQATAQSEEGNDGGSERSSEEGNQPNALQSTSTLEKPALASSPSENGTSTSTQSPVDPLKQNQHLTTPDALSSPVIPASDDNNSESVNTFHSVQLLHHQLELQTQQTHLLVSQMQLVKDQLAIEMAARTKAQAQVHQLLVQNRDLLMYVSSAVGRLVQLEPSVSEYLTSKVLDPASVGPIIDPSLFISAPSHHLSNLGENSSFLGVNSCPALKETSSGNYIKNEMVDKECFTAEEINSYNIDGLRQKSADSTDEPDTDSVNQQNGRAGEDLLFGSTSPLQNGGSKKDELRLPSTGACRSRLDLGIAPKLDPPPKVNRNSFRVLGQTSASANGKPTAMNSTLSAVSADSSDTGQKYADAEEKQHKWEKLNGATDLNTLLSVHPGDFKNSPKKLLEEIAYYDGNGNNCKPLEPLRGPAFAIQGLKGIRNRFVIQHQNSVDSTSKLRLSFSDNE